MLTEAQISKVRKSVEAKSDELPALFGALADPGRFRIFKLLLSHKDLCVTDIANVLNISVPAASQQLRIMELSGLVAKERMGQMTCYVVRRDDPLIKPIINLIT